jgi:PAS domain S-box-containing protein
MSMSMDIATLSAGPRRPPETGAIRRIADDLVRIIRDLGVAEKIYGIAAGLVIVTTVLLVMSMQTVRLQAGYRHLQASSAEAATNIGRVDGLIYSIVMESRGIYMSADRSKAKPFGDELLTRNRELAEVMTKWEGTVLSDDAEQFSAFRQRITQFIDFRRKLGRLATEVSPAAARELGDNEANRTLRSQLNVDLEALARIYDRRARDAADLGDQGRYASWYLLVLGLGALVFASLNVFVVKTSVIGPLSEITAATDRIVAGNVEGEIPHYVRPDEIGRLALAVENFRNVVSRNVELEQLGNGNAQQRDAAIAERDKFSDRYFAAKWQLSAAINSMPQGIIMLDAKGVVLAINDHYRKIYALPATIKAGSSLEQILRHRAETGLFTGDIAEYLAAILARIAKRGPAADEIVLGDGRIVSIQEQSMEGGGWVALHEDVTGQRQQERILERTEQFLATVVENIPEGIVVKDARNLRYVFINKAAEDMIGMSRADIMGKTARELFSVETAELIERRDRQLMARAQQPEAIVDTVDHPVRGRRTIAVRRLQVGGPDRESHLFVSMIEDHTEQSVVAA